MSFITRRRPLVEAEEKSVKRCSTQGLEGSQLVPHPPCKAVAMTECLPRFSTPETDPRRLLKGKLYNIRGKSYSEQKPKIPQLAPGSAPREFFPDSEYNHRGNESPLLEPQSAFAVASVPWGDDSPVRVRRRKPVDLAGVQQKDLSTSLIDGGQLQRDEAMLLRSKKAAQRREMQEALGAQIAEKQRKKRMDDLGLRASQPIKATGSQELDLSPVLSGSTEDPEHRCFPSPSSYLQPKERILQLKPVPKTKMRPTEEQPTDEFRKLRYPGSNSPERNVFGLNLEGKSEFVYPERVSMVGYDEIDRFLGQVGGVQVGQEPESPLPPGRMSEPSHCVGASFPRHVFGGRNYRRAVRRAL